MVQVQSITEAVPAQPAVLRGLLFEQLVSLLIIAVAPTVFWTGLICIGASAYGSPIAMWAACAISVLIFTFLVCVWAAFALTHKSEAIEQDAR